MIIVVSLIVLVTAGIIFFPGHKQFGRIPRGERLFLIKQSPNYRDDSFQNLNVTPQFTGDKGFLGMISSHINAVNKRPSRPLPSIYTNLRELPSAENVLVWFGHSSYYIQLDGKKMLIDPVFSGSASPFPFSVRAFPGTDRYTTADIPDLDYLIITHDHWDHLDYQTAVRLKNRVKLVITGLGTGGHFERWGYDKDRIIELDWYQQAEPDLGFVFTATPARHFSGRGLRHKKTLWVSFALNTPTMKLFIGGDGGYDNHFREIGNRFGGFDLAILENGQYNQAWKHIHMMPEEAVTAAADLRAKRLFPVHSSKFALSLHPWDEPLKRITMASQQAGLPLVTPRIGEKVWLTGPEQQFDSWWENVHSH